MMKAKSAVLLALCFLILDAHHAVPVGQQPGTSAPKKRVLILGDSISVGYTPFVRAILNDEAEVVRPMLSPDKPENCEGTSKGVRDIERWLQLEGGRWDVIHFNFGLHDLKRVDPQSGEPSNDRAHPRQAALDVYEQQLRNIVASLKSTGARLIFATTTPVPKGQVKPHRDVEDVASYNRAAIRVMRESGVAVDDLYSLALPQLHRIQLPVNVHFTGEGYELLAREVARHIRHAFGSGHQMTGVTATRRPNVIVIMTDDQGTMDANCYGAEDLMTPGIDELAERGVRFSQFYAGAPICSPSRAALLTGRYPARAGVPANVSSKQGEPGMPAAQVTLAEILKAAGYATSHIGKWHLGYTPETMPNAQGFDYSFGHMGGCIDNFSHFFYWSGPNRHDLWRNGEEIQAGGSYFPDLMVEEAARFLEANRNRPFFLYFAMNTPHYPYQGEPCWLEHYKDLPYPRNLYAAFVSTLDARIRQLLTRLDELGLQRDTVVVYQSDNGYSTEERAHFGGGFAGPYRGAKFSLFEGGIRVPAIISWPGRLPEGEVRDQVSHACDWLPTIATLCRVELQERDLDGRNLGDVLRAEDAPSPHDVLHWSSGEQWAVREGDWKLIANPQDTSNKGRLGEADKFFLSNLRRDETEMTNLAAEHRERVNRLKKLHETWGKTTVSLADVKK